MKPNFFTGQACAKFILLGDHFVAHGSPAIAFPVKPLFCQIRLQHLAPSEALTGWPMRAEIQGVQAVKGSGGVGAKMKKTLVAALSTLKMPEDSSQWSIHSQTNFSTSRGFGSSAAFSAALLRALLSFQCERERPLPDQRELPDILQSMEKIFHANPSGVDATTIWNEQAVFFQDGELKRLIKNTLADFILVDSGERKGTAELVKKVTEFRERNLGVWESYSKKVENLALESEKFLADSTHEALKNLGEVISEAHGILSELSLSNAVIDEMISVSCGLGAVAGKVSGAGTGGAIVLLAPRGEGKKVAQKMAEKKIPVLVLVEADGH